MDKNQIIGVVLIFLLVIGYTFYNAPSEAEIARSNFVQDSLEQVQNLALEQSLLPAAPSSQEQAIAALPDSLQVLENQGKFGAFSSASIGNNDVVALENEKMKISFSSKGAVIKEAFLKEHYKVLKDTSGQKTKVNLVLLQDEKNRFDYNLPIAGVPGGIVKSGDLYYTAAKSGNSVSFTAKATNGGSLVQTYTLVDDYTLDYKVSFEGLGSTVYPQDGAITLSINQYLDKIELNDPFEKRYSTTYFQEADESSADYCSCTTADTENPEKSIHWFTHSNQFFNTSWIATNGNFKSGEFTTDMLTDEGADLKLLKSNVGIPYAGGNSETFAMQMYVGPNDYEKLTAFDIGIEQIIPFGNSIFGTINRWVIRPAFNFLTSFISSKGIAIIIMIFIIKLLLYPLTYKMLHSQAKMQALKPTLAGLTEKFKDDAQKKQVETMKIYREYGVSPLGGCMPMVLQMPIWYALFRFFPASITFRQESFLWADDLSSFDDLILLPFEIPMYGAHISLFTIFWAVTTVMYTYYNTKHMDMSANPAMKYVQYAMPLMFLVFFNNYASGLTCYMFFSNLFNILQTVITKKFVFNDDKIKEELNKQKAKPKKKKSGFQSRLEEAMKNQQEQAKQAQAKKKK